MTNAAPQEIKLVTSIRDRWHVEIAAAIGSSGVPDEFLAALIANETGGDPTKHRFEKGVLAQVWEVLLGRADHFGSLTRDELEIYAISSAGNAIVDGSEYFLVGCRGVDDLCTSWGLTQIMGYEAIALGVPLAALQTPASSLQVTCRMLAQFAKANKIDLNDGHEAAAQLFDCWNTGRPHAPTADPQYIPNGLARLAIYRDLGEEPPSKGISA